jgi:hypothetical protein
MKRQRVFDHHGAVHEGLFNSYTGFLIDLTCEQNRYAIVHPYHQMDPARLTVAPLSCPVCQEITAGGPGAPPHPAELTLTHAQAVLAHADRQRRVPALDNEGLRLAFEGMARRGGMGDPPATTLYPLVQEHLADLLTERALSVPVGTPEAWVRYTRFTGGAVTAPVCVGDRLLYDGTASGLWMVAEVDAIEEDAKDGVVVTLLYKDWPPPRRWESGKLSRWFSKLDRTSSSPPDALLPDSTDQSGTGPAGESTA